MKVELVSAESLSATEEPEGLDWALVARIETVLANGWDIAAVPPVQVIAYTERTPRGRQERFYIHDGHHRYQAAIEAGYDEIPIVNLSAMTRGDKSAYSRSLRKYRRLVRHPLAG